MSYGWFKFESVSTEIAKKKEAIDVQKGEIDKSAFEVQTKAAQSDKFVNNSQALLDGANRYQDDRKNDANQVMSLLQQQIANSLTSSNSQLSTFADTQGKFMLKQRELLNDTKSINEKAMNQADKITTAAINSQTELVDKMQMFNDQVTQVRDEILTKQATIQNSLDKSLSLQELTLKLAQTQATSQITLADRQSADILLQDPAPPLAKPEDLRKYRVHFTVGDMGRGPVKINYTIYLVDTNGNPKSTIRDDVWIVPGKRPTSEAAAPSLPLEGTKFRAILIQKYNGFFAPEFIVIKIVPVAT
ncbi:MAG: hypothetical protein ABIZ95_06915 [Pyrinomonadaceae bacterium]